MVTNRDLAKIQIKADGPVDLMNVASYLFVQSVEIPAHDDTPESRKARMQACEESAKVEIESLLTAGEIAIYADKTDALNYAETTEYW